MTKLLLSVTLLGSLALGGCVGDGVSPQYYSVKYQAPPVPYQLFSCPTVKVIASRYRTEKDLAHLLVEYNAALRKCRLSLEAVKQYLEHQRDTLNH